MNLLCRSMNYEYEMTPGITAGFSMLTQPHKIFLKGDCVPALGPKFLP